MFKSLSISSLIILLNSVNNKISCDPNHWNKYCETSKDSILINNIHKIINGDEILIEFDNSFNEDEVDKYVSNDNFLEYNCNALDKSKILKKK